MAKKRIVGILLLAVLLVVGDGNAFAQSHCDQATTAHRREDGKYVFDRKLGLMREVVVTRSTSMVGMTMDDIWQIRLLSGPKR